MSRRRKVRCKISEVRALGLILLWVVLYFNIFRFTSIQTFGQTVSLGLKLAAFLALLVVALYTVIGIYRGLMTQSPKRISAAWFLAVFLLSMIFAVACSDRQVLFRVLSVSIFAFDRLLYFAVYRKQFRLKNLVPP